VLGVSVTTGFWELGPIESFAEAVNHNPGLVMNYQAWNYSQPSLATFPVTQLNSMLQAGYLPEITWDPMDAYSGPVDANYTLSSIINGTHDSYIEAWAAAAKQWGHPLLLRFAPEMNGDWLPWGQGVNGNLPGQYVLAWQHVFQIFASIGATNVQWVWSPNVVTSTTTGPTLSSFYPGNAYVNLVGMDGYSYPLGGCLTGQQLFGQTLQDITAFAPTKPILIAETAVATSCPDQATLITQLFAWVQQEPSIVGVTWFDHPGQPDYQVDTDPSAALAISNSPITS
jgi:beta-mannanase